MLWIANVFLKLWFAEVQFFYPFLGLLYSSSGRFNASHTLWGCVLIRTAKTDRARIGAPSCGSERWRWPHKSVIIHPISCHALTHKEYICIYICICIYIYHINSLLHIAHVHIYIQYVYAHKKQILTYINMYGCVPYACDCLIYQSADSIVDAHPKSPAANSRAFYWYQDSGFLLLKKWRLLDNWRFPKSWSYPSNSMV
jgi:hypothetical protein